MSVNTGQATGGGTVGKETPVLIYCPGLGHSQANSADVLADIIANDAELHYPGYEFSSKSDTSASAPGLKVAKTIVDKTGKPVLQLFQFDYETSLAPKTTSPLPSVVPGLLRSAAYALRGAGVLLKASSRPAKTARTKLQLWLGLGLLLVLIFTALVALYALLKTAQVPIPDIWFLSDQSAPRTFGITSLGLVVTWSALRTKLLGIAATTQYLLAYIYDDQQIADSTTVKLDDALVGLKQSGWIGDIHLLGYSFGSMVLFETLCPRKTGRMSSAPLGSVASMVTVGFPLDLVRLYYPSYLLHRQSRHPTLPWTNIFNKADIFASNLQNKNDVNEGPSDDNVLPDQGATSMRYTEQTLSWFQIFTAGEMHASYWTQAGQANCFGDIIPTWIPSGNGSDPEPPTHSSRSDSTPPETHSETPPETRPAGPPGGPAGEPTSAQQDADEMSQPDPSTAGSPGFLDDQP